MLIPAGNARLAFSFFFKATPTVFGSVARAPVTLASDRQARTRQTSHADPWADGVEIKINKQRWIFLSLPLSEVLIKLNNALVPLNLTLKLILRDRFFFLNIKSSVLK